MPMKFVDDIKLAELVNRAENKNVKKNLCAIEKLKQN